MDTANWYDGQNHIAPQAPASLTADVDNAVIKKLPEDCVVVGITPHGQSFWGRTAKITTHNADGSEVLYFLKVHQGEDKEDLVAGEHMAMSIMHKALPELVPAPVAYGCYDSMPDTWFYIAEFREMIDELPDVEEFCELMARLHARGTNPEGKFGWPYFVFAGRSARAYPLSYSWEETFTKGFAQTFDLEEKAQGPDEEWSQLRQALFDKVIPRLLRPLETGGREIKPTIIHGDMWHGNAAVDASTGTSVIFDPTPMYAHFEMELGPWACPRHRIGIHYIKEYLKHCPASEPAEDFEDRMLLYATSFDVQSSSNYPGNLRRREIARAQIKQLVEKFPDGYEGWEADHQAPKAPETEHTEPDLTPPKMVGVYPVNGYSMAA